MTDQHPHFGADPSIPTLLDLGSGRRWVRFDAALAKRIVAQPGRFLADHLNAHALDFAGPAYVLLRDRVEEPVDVILAMGPVTSTNQNRLGLAWHTPRDVMTKNEDVRRLEGHLGVTFKADCFPGNRISDGVERFFLRSAWVEEFEESSDFKVVLVRPPFGDDGYAKSSHRLVVAPMQGVEACCAIQTGNRFDVYRFKHVVDMISNDWKQSGTIVLSGADNMETAFGTMLSEMAYEPSGPSMR